MNSKHSSQEQTNTDTQTKAQGDKHDPAGLALRVITAIGGIIGLVASIEYSSRPHSANYLLLSVAVLSVIDLEVYYQHRYNRRSPELEPLFLEIAGAWCLLFLLGGVYLVFTESQAKALFTNGGLPQSPSNELVIAFGGANFKLADGLYDAVRAGIPSAPKDFGEKTPDGKYVSPFYLYVLNGRFYCDFNIFAGEGKPPIVVQRNQIIKPLPPGWLSNNNDNALEVVDDNQNPIFQMYYDGPNKIVFNGIFTTPSFVYFAGDLSEQSLVFALRSNNPDLPILFQAFKLRRLFKYPHAVFPGVPN